MRPIKSIWKFTFPNNCAIKKASFPNPCIVVFSSAFLTPTQYKSSVPPFLAQFAFANSLFRQRYRGTVFFVDSGTQATARAVAEPMSWLKIIQPLRLGILKGLLGPQIYRNPVTQRIPLQQLGQNASVTILAEETKAVPTDWIVAPPSPMDLGRWVEQSTDSVWEHFEHPALRENTKLSFNSVSKLETVLWSR